MYELISQKKLNITKCLADKLTSIIGCDIKPPESILKGNVASKKVVPFVKPLSCFKMDGLEVL
jgi:hypothetical protein